MKEHPVDQFFNKHLGNIELEPSADVWNKIDHHLVDKRKPWGLYLSIAASFTIILAVFSYVLLKPQGSKPVEQQYFEQIQKQNTISNKYRPKSIQPSGTVPGSENSIPVMAQESHKKTINKHTNLYKKMVAMVDYSGDESEFSESDIWKIDAITLDKTERKSKKFGISLSNSNKYLKPQVKEEKYGDKLKSYTAAQWDNITKRTKLETPPLPNLKLPKIKFDKTLKTDQ